MASSRAIRAGRAFVEFFLEDNNLKRGLVVAERRMRQFGARVQNIGRTALTVGLGGLASFALPVATFAKFDDAIRAVGAVTGATGTDFDMLRDKALELGRTTSFTAGEVASLMTELGRAGFNPAEIDAMTASVLNLARATGTDATLSSGIMAATLRQFSMGAGQAAHVADVLTMAANKTFNTVEQLGEALSYAGPVAADLGMSLEDTVAILGTLGNVGIQGSNAGTALRRLGTITAAEADKMKEIFGVGFLDAAGNVRPLTEVMGELGRATENLPSGERAKKFNDAFGLLGITAASVMSGVAGDTQNLADALRTANDTAAQTAAKMDAGIGGAWRRMMSAIEGTTIAIGESLGPMLERLGAWIGDNATRATAWVAANEGLVVSIAQGVAVFTAAGIALMGIGFAAKLAAVAISILTMAVALLTNPWILAAAAIAGVIAYLGVADGAFTSLANTITNTFGGAWDAIVGRISSGDLAGAMTLAWEMVKATWTLGIETIKLGWSQFTGWFSTGVHEMILAIGGAWDGFWSGLYYAAARDIAHIKDAWYGMVDAANRAIGRNVSPRASFADKVSAENRKAIEERAANRADRREAFADPINAANRMHQAAIEASQQKIRDLIAEDLEKQRQAREKPQAEAMAQARPVGPAEQLRSRVMEATRQSVGASAIASDAVEAGSLEGQKVINKAMGFGDPKDTVGAIQSLESTLEDEFERTRRDNAAAPRIAGSRKG